MGSTAYTTQPLPRWMDGTQAWDCAALARRLRWVRAAPFGVPVVPDVYWMIARSSVPGCGCEAGIGAPATTDSQRTVPRTRSVSAARDSLAFATGSRSAKRVSAGMARVTSTDTSVETARSLGNS